MFVLVLQITEGYGLLRVPGRERGTSQALSQDLVTQSQALRIEVEGEDAALGLAHIAISQCCGDGVRGVSP